MAFYGLNPARKQAPGHKHQATSDTRGDDPETDRDQRAARDPAELGGVDVLGDRDPARVVRQVPGDVAAQHVGPEAHRLIDRDLARIHPGSRRALCHPRRVLHLRPAGIDDLAVVLPRTLALNAHEGIAVDPRALEAALDRLLRDPALGGVWLIERSETGGGDPEVIGYAMVTFGYDLEFAGRDAFLTELWIDPPARGSGAG